jgi:hypothetical protein
MMHNLINQGKQCPYCGNKTEYVDSAIVYGVSYGMIYYCEPCYAWVGTHKGSDIALGRLANAELRELKKQAHSAFDVLWKFENQKNKARNKAYAMLSKKMNLPPELTHIGMFDVEQCKKVIEICQIRLNYDSIQ